MLSVFSKAEDALYQATHSLLEATQKGKVLWVDGSNAFDPYLVLRLSGSEVKAKQVLHNTLLSRPFTIYQLKRAIEMELREAVSRHHPNRIILLGITELFLDEDREQEEREQVLQDIVQHLQFTRRKTGVPLHVYLYHNSFTEQFQEAWHGQNRSLIPLRD